MRTHVPVFILDVRLPNQAAVSKEPHLSIWEQLRGSGGGGSGDGGGSGGGGDEGRQGDTEREKRSKCSEDMQICGEQEAMW